jgi:PAS domain S-box-containing protein
MNPAISEISGYTHEEITTGGLGLILTGEDLNKLNNEYLPEAIRNRRVDFEMWINRKDGKIRSLSFSAFAATLHSGETGVGIIARDETEKKLMQRELLEAKERTEKALLQQEYYNKAKSDFLSRMSHEMRTPLNAIIGMTGIARNAEDAVRRKGCLDKADESSRHLLNIINNVLDMSQLDTGKFVLSPKEFKFREMMGNVSAAASPGAKARGQEFSIKINPDIPDQLEADDHRLSQVLGQLLSNAVKFTPENGRIDLLAELAEPGFQAPLPADICVISFTVSNSGQGIPGEAQARLFHAFEQADNSITREHGGTGLGLAIAKGIVELMGGSIRSESDMGRETRFIFTVRAKRIQAGQAAPAGNNRELNLSGKRILIVDDVDMNREILLALLEDTGAVLSTAENGAEAVSFFTEKGCDLILMDLHMPNMTGLEAARRIRASALPGADTIPIIAVTADSDGDMRQRCAEAGMNDQIAKPVNFGILFETIRKQFS